MDCSLQNGRGAQLSCSSPSNTTLKHLAIVTILCRPCPTLHPTGLPSFSPPCACPTPCPRRCPTFPQTITLHPSGQTSLTGLSKVQLGSLQIMSSRFLGGDDKCNFFTRAQRSRMVFEILSTTAFGREKKGEVGVERLVDEGGFSGCFPLHDVRISINIFYNVLSR